MKKALLFALLLAAAAPLIAQDPGQRPQPLGWTPKTTASTVSVSWFSYALSLEAALAARDASIADLKAALATASKAATDNAATADAIRAVGMDVAMLKAAVAAIKFPPTTPVVTPSDTGPKTGGTITLTATADGNPPLTWQWKKNGSPVAGWTSASITMVAITSNDSAVYTAVATNEAGTSEASITVSVAP